jgi:ribulose-phosphate 3-epimerase
MKRSAEILPAILAKSASEFRRKLTQVRGEGVIVHVDVMDGKFVKNKTWAVAKTVASWHLDAEYSLHLMVNDPLPIFMNWMKVRGLKRVVFHLETPKDIKRLIKEAADRCIDVGLAINPGTPLSKLAPHAGSICEVLVMGNVPGFSGKGIKPQTVKMVRDVHRKWPHLPIAFDIGVNAASIPMLKRAGVSRFCAGTAVFGTKNPRKALIALRRRA